MNSPAVDPTPRPRVQLFDRDWNILADTMLDRQTSVSDWLRANAAVGNGVRLFYHGERHVGTVGEDGTIRPLWADLRAFKWPTSPFGEHA